jgi:hypothetical protein
VGGEGVVAQRDPAAGEGAAGGQLEAGDGHDPVALRVRSIST